STLFPYTTLFRSQALEQMPEGLTQQADVYLVALGDVQAHALQLAEHIRDQLPYIRIINHCGGGSLKSQMKKADKSAADIAIILGEDEVKSGKFAVKYLRYEQPQEFLTQTEIIKLLQSLAYLVI